MSRIVFLLEERSMQVLLDGLLPRLFPDLPFLCVPHEEPFRHPPAHRRKSTLWRHRRTVHLQEKHGFVKNSGGKSAQNSSFGPPRALSGIPSSNRMLLESKHIINSAVHPFSGTAFVVEFLPLSTRTGRRREDSPVCFQGNAYLFQEHFEDFSQFLLRKRERPRYLSMCVIPASALTASIWTTPDACMRRLNSSPPGATGKSDSFRLMIEQLESRASLVNYVWIISFLLMIC